LKTVLVRIALSAGFLIIMSCPVLGSPPETGQLTYKLQEILPRDSRWGLSVVAMKAGQETYSFGVPDVRFIPASLMKLFTAGAALEMEVAGRPVQLVTDILHDGRLDGTTLNGNIYLLGNGNCLLTTDDLRKAAQIIKEKGIGRITGKIVADATRFDAHGLERIRKGTGYAPVSALGLDLHTVAVIVEPTGAGKPPKVTIEPPNEMVRFAVAGRTTTSGTSSIEVKQIDDGSYRIGGDIPVGSVPARRRFALSDPARYAVGSFRTMLQQAGIAVLGDVTQGKSPEGASLLARIPGPSLQRYVTEMNRNSLNVAADNLLLILGGISGGYPATREMGLNVLKAHISRYGLSDIDVTVVDGSGLLPGNKVTPKAMARYLASVSKQAWFGDFRSGLPRPGMVGTLQGSTFRHERFHVKTGNLENATSLAGYGVDRKGSEIAFAFIVESPTVLPPNAQRVVDEILEYLAEK
jgi:D-alanyl-D-alanine carboxypeptidase/D-alanyl-D-alanine-endopeptidase (penicillin-binding protein 4)